MLRYWMTGLVFASAFLLACEDADDAPSPSVLEVTGHGFYSEPDAAPGEYKVYYAVTFQNNESSRAMVGGDYEVTFLDNDGNAVATDAMDFSVVLPGQEVAKASTAPATSEPASIEVRIDAGDLREVEDTPVLAPVDGTYQPDPGIGSSTVTAVLDNPYPIALRETEIVAVFRDQSGSITGGWVGFVSEVPAEREVEVSINVIAQPPTEPASVEVYPSISLLSFPEIINSTDP